MVGSQVLWENCSRYDNMMIIDLFPNIVVYLSPCRWSHNVTVQGIITYLHANVF